MPDLKVADINMVKKARNIVVLLDGTSNQFGEHNSNLIKTMAVLKADETQLLYYSSGIGTILPESTTTWLEIRQKTAEWMDLAFAHNFETFVCDAYKYLMDVFQKGDQIYILGFSRGAYTARALAGMIQRVGLLNPLNHNQVQLAYDVYTGPLQVPAPGGPKDPAVLYRRIFGLSRPVNIHFLGVWDTVSSLGGVNLRRLPFANGAKSVAFFRQALALDERRARFVPEYWRMTETEAELRNRLASMRNIPQPSEQEQIELDAIVNRLQKEYPEFVTSASGRKMRRREEVWFLGCHSDVGGGNDTNDDPSLSNIPFRWMLREAVRCGVILGAHGVSLQPALGLTPSIYDQLPVATRETFAQLREQLYNQSDDAAKILDEWEVTKALCDRIPQEDLANIVELCARADSYPEGGTLSADALRPIKESLKGAWWVLEYLSLRTRDYRPDGQKEEDRRKRNKGGGRQMIPGQKLHRSVLLRLAYDAEQAGGTLPREPAAAVPERWPTWQDIAEGRLAHDLCAE